MYAHVEERLRQGIFLVVKSNDTVLSQGLGGGGGRDGLEEIWIRRP